MAGPRHAKDIVVGAFEEHQAVLKEVQASLADQLVAVGRSLAAVLARDGTLFWCGNGGSAGDSQHLAAELVGRFKSDRRPLRSVALTTDSSVLTCIANDYSYADVFARQLEGVSRRGDAVVAISTSGNSENVVRALETGEQLGLETFAFLGGDGGRCRAIAGTSLVVPSISTARVQEMHILAGQIVCEVIELELGLQAPDSDTN